jgi:hypothetical protein
VLIDIEEGSVFDDILIEYDQVLAKSFLTLGYNIDQLKNSMVIPNFEDSEKVIEDLKDYYYELISVAQKRYDEVKVILETYFRQQISLKREELDVKHQQDEEGNEDDYQLEANTFAYIAD